MPSDAHCHPLDLLCLYPGAEAERRSLGIAAAASAWNREEFLHHEEIAAAAQRDKAAPLFLCFAVHPQLTVTVKTERQGGASQAFRDELDLLSALAAEGRISAIGEAGFDCLRVVRRTTRQIPYLNNNSTVVDLYAQEFRETETVQDELFAAQLEIARRHDLPLVLHVRRAMHKIFPHAKALKALPAVVFHSWPGSPDEGISLLRRGIRAFFSFGTPLIRGHKNAIRSCAAFPAEHILLETDAPYQPLPGKDYSSWADWGVILKAAAAIRKDAGKPGKEPEELEQITDRNFISALQ